MAALALKVVLAMADTAEYSFDGYYVYVSDETIEGNGYHVSICKEAMPPHVSINKDSIDDVEAYLDGSLGYKRGTEVWTEAEA